MNPKPILTEDGWDKVAPENCNGKDKELRKSFSSYSSLKPEDFDSQCKTLVKIAAQATTLKSANEVKGDKDAVKHLADVITAAKREQGEVTKAKAEAEKALALAAKAEALNKKKADEDAKKQEKKDGDSDESKDEELETNSIAKLTKLLKGLRISNVPYFFLLCPIRPYGLVLSKKDIRKSGPHKQELAKLAGGTTRGTIFGTCMVESGKLVFQMENAASGPASPIQQWIKKTTKENFSKVVMGSESAEDEEEQ